MTHDKTARARTQSVLDELGTAATLLTCVPIMRPAGETPFDDALARSVWAWPVLGTAIGAFAGGVLAIAAAAQLSPWLSAALAVLSMILVTGALHEDGLADMADGLGGGLTRERRLEIMRDSRIGSFGAIALGFSLVLRIGALAAIATPIAAVIALMVAATVSRSMMAGVPLMLAPARREGLGAAAATPTLARAAAGLAFAASLAIAALGTGSALLVLGCAILAAAFAAALARRLLGGYTGDVLGATQQCAEAAALVTLAGIY